MVDRGAVPGGVTPARAARSTLPDPHRTATMHRRLPLRPLLTAACLLAVACSDPLAPLPRSGPPARMEFSTGGFYGASRFVRTQGDSVSYVRRSWDGVTTDSAWVRPTEAQWRAFWTAARAAGVQRWKGDYLAEGIADGSAWTLAIEAGGDTRRATGANAYPDYLGREHEGEPTEEFNHFLDALGALVGREL